MAIKIKKIACLLILTLCSVVSLPALAVVTAISFDCNGKATNDLVAGDVVSVVHTFDQTGSFAHALVRTNPNQLYSAVGSTNYVAGVPTTVTQTLTQTPAAGTLRFAIQFYQDNVLIVCPAALTVVKTIVNDDGGTVIDPNDFFLTVDGNSVSHNSVNNFAPGTYTVSETSLAGYAAGNWGGDCAVDGSIILATGDDATCTITNDDIAPQLTLLKVVNNSVGSAAAGDWTLEANLGGGAAEISGASGVSATIDAGDYVLSEINGPAGYTQNGLSCDAGALDTGTSTLSIGLAEDVTCTFTNRDLITDLQIIKTVSDLNPSIGDTVTFMLEVINDGPDDATNVVIEDTVQAGFTFVANSMMGGTTQNQTAPNLIWTIDPLPAGSANAVTLTFQAMVN